MLIANRAQLVVLKVKQLTLLQLLVFCLPVCLGLGLGYLISRGDWLYAIAVAFVFPLAVIFTARPFIGVILWLLIIPLYSAFPNTELMYWVFHRILITFTLIMSLLPLLVKSSSQLPHFRFGTPEVCIALLAAYVPISLLVSDRDINLHLMGYLERMLIPFAMYLIMRVTVLDKWKLQLLQWTVLFIAVSQCIIGLMSWFSPGLLPTLWLSYFKTRMSGSLLNPNVYGVMLVFCAVILFQSALSRPPGLIRSSFLLICGLCTLCAFLSMERAVWLGTVAAILGLFILYPRPMLRYITIAIVIFSLIGVSFLSEKISQASVRIKSQGQVDVRIVLMDAMLQMIQVKPVFGWGYGSINQYISDYYRPVGSASVPNRFETSHNSYLTIFSELGLVGILLYMLPVIWLLRASWRAWREPPKMLPARRLLLAAFWLAALQHFIVSNFMDMRFFTNALTLWWMNLGLIANLVYEQAEIRNMYVSNRAVQTLRQNQFFEELLLEKNGA